MRESANDLQIAVAPFDRLEQAFAVIATSGDVSDEDLVRRKDVTDGGVQRRGGLADCDGKDEEGEVVRRGFCGESALSFVGRSAEGLVCDVCDD